MSSRADHRSRRAAGFTLIELLVVIAIIATLAAVVAPAIFRNIGDAKQAAARSQIEALALALTQYRIDNDAFPTTEEGLDGLRVPPGLHGAGTAGTAGTGTWKGPYLSRVLPMDPWGRPYQYASPGLANPASYDLYTLGRDGRAGGEGEDEDVTSWGGPVDGPTATPGIP